MSVRLLLVTPFVPHARVGHGTATVATHVVDHFRRRHDVTVACFSFNDKERALAEELRADGVDLHVVPFPDSAVRAWTSRVASVVRGTPYTIALFDVPEMRRLIARLVAQSRFDLAQFDTTFAGPYVDVIPASTKTVLVEIDFTVKPLRRRLSHQPAGLKRAWYRRELEQMLRYEPSLCRRFDSVLAVSDEDRSELLRLDPSLRVGVLRYGADPALFQIPIEPVSGRSSVLFLGAFLHKPNVDAVWWLSQEILPRLRALAPGAAVTCVGGDPPADLRAAAAAAGAIVTGWVPDIPAYLATADVGIVPLRMGGGVKLKTLEMMAAGRAIVTTPIGIEGIEAVDGEHVLVATTAAQFAAQIARLLGDTGLRARLGRNARDLALRNHRWATNLAGLEQDYLELVQGCRLEACAV